MTPEVVLGAAVIFCVGVFWLARQIAKWMDPSLRKFVLYTLAFGGTLFLVMINKTMSDLTIIMSFTVLIVSIFAMITAPGEF